MSVLHSIDVAPIGHVVESAFQHKWGTPRQGALVPTAITHIEFMCAQQLQIGDRVGLVWSAHLNSQSSNPLKGKIKPPKLDGGLVGVFATRGVHRPSSLGLSFCTVIALPTDLHVVVGGGDMILKTPILGIHRCGSFEFPPIAKFPQWTQNIQPIKIRWSIGSIMSANATMIQLVNEVLSQDPRSVHSVRKHLDPIYEIELHAGDHGNFHVIYRHQSEEIQVLFLTKHRLVAEFRERSELWLRRLVDKLSW